MTASRDDTSSSITLLNFALTNVVTCSPPYFTACNSLTMRLFSTIKNRTLELVAFAYALVASTNVVLFFHTSDTITHSSNYTRDMWTSGLGTVHDCTTLWCDSSKDMLCISTSRFSSRIFVSP